MRAEAPELALRAASILVVRDGSRSVGRHEHRSGSPEKRCSLLVFASRPPIRAALLERLAPS